MRGTKPVKTVVRAIGPVDVWGDRTYRADERVEGERAGQLLELYPESFELVQGEASFEVKGEEHAG